MTTAEESCVIKHNINNIDPQKTHAIQFITTHPIVQISLNNDGYVAGGSLRYIFRNQDLDKLKEYFKNDGDIDVFFNTELGYETSLKEIKDFVVL